MKKKILNAVRAALESLIQEQPKSSMKNESQSISVSSAEEIQQSKLDAKLADASTNLDMLPTGTRVWTDVEPFVGEIVSYLPNWDKYTVRLLDGHLICLDRAEFRCDESGQLLLAI